MNPEVSETMTLEAEVREALDREPDHRTLLEIMRRYKERGGTQQKAYETLQRIWLEFGFDDDDHNAPNRTRDELEYSMEVVWGFCSNKQRIWKSSLTND